MAHIARTWCLSRTSNTLVKRGLCCLCRKRGKLVAVTTTKKDLCKTELLNPPRLPVCCSVLNFGSHYENWSSLKYDDFIALLESRDIQLIDVREEKKIQEQGAFPNAINIPLAELKEALKLEDAEFSRKYKVNKPQPEDTNIVFVSLKSVKSTAALEIAHRLGFKNARQYGNGYEEWKSKQEEAPGGKRVGAS